MISEKLQVDIMSKILYLLFSSTNCVTQTKHVQSPSINFVFKAVYVRPLLVLTNLSAKYAQKRKQTNIPKRTRKFQPILIP